jgi:hypothetical protein
VGIGQRRAQGPDELPLVTAGDDLDCVAQFIPPGRDSYSAADVLRQLLPPVERPPSSEISAVQLSESFRSQR